MRVVRVFHHWYSQRKLALFLLEQATLAVAFAAASLVMARAGPGLGAEGARSLLLALGAALAFQVGFYFADLYDLRAARDDRVRGIRLLWATGGATLLAAPLVFLEPWISPGSVLAGLGGTLAAALALRFALPRLVGPPERILVVGSGPRARALAHAIEKGGEGGFEIVGFLDAPQRAASATSRGLSGEVDAVARRLQSQIVAVALEDAEQVPAEALLRCRLEGREVLDATALSERVLRRLPVTELRAAELAFSDGFRSGRAQDLVKRGLDLLAASALAVLAAPWMALAVALIKLDSKGPALYRQERVGRGGRIFLLTKLRTMRLDAEADGRPVWAQVGDARVTRVGRWLRKTRMDEVPQILGVLKGDMSFVGPRPERPFFVAQIKEQVPFYELRERVKPGITGWAQLRYPYGASVEDARAKLEYDLYYLKNRSLFLDLTIIFHTVRHVLMGRGAR